MKHMRYVMTFFWGIILIQMINYILGSMTSVTNLTFDTALIVGVVFSILIIILGTLFKGESPDNTHEQHS